MNKITRFCMVAWLLLLLGAGPVLADDNAPTQINSAHYGIQSFFFGATGTVFNYTASIPPVITSPPTVTDITETSATIAWTTDTASTSTILLGTTSGKYLNQFGSADNTLTVSHSVIITGLVRGTTYYFKAQSVDIDGNTAQSTEDSFESDPGDITPPVITSGPSISIDSASLITVTWTTNELASTVVQYGTTNVTENSIGPADDLTEFHQVHIPGLTPAQSYIMRVKTEDASGNITYSPTQTLATPTSPFISGFAITDITLTSAVIQWTTSTASTTLVAMGTQSAVYDKNITDQTYTTNHILRLANLSSGTTYYLKVSGVDQAGNLLQSDEKIFATVVVPQITNLAVSDILPDSATVTWISSSPIDELVQYSVIKNSDPTLVGESGSGGSADLVTSHTLQLKNLESSSTYQLSVLGKDIFGNQAISSLITFVTPIDKTPPQLLNVKSDTTIDLGSQQTVQVLVSCDLSKLGKIVVQYGAGASGPYTNSVNTDATYSLSKFVVIPGLQPGQTYHYRIVATDKVGNTASSPDYLVLAPTQPVSLLDLIFGQIRNNFGWLSNV